MFVSIVATPRLAGSQVVTGSEIEAELDRIKQEYDGVLKTVGPVVVNDIEEAIAFFLKKLYSDIEKENRPVEDIADRAQTQYQILSKRMNLNNDYARKYMNLTSHYFKVPGNLKMFFFKPIYQGEYTFQYCF